MDRSNVERAAKYPESYTEGEHAKALGRLAADIAKVEAWYAKPTGCGGQSLVIAEGSGRNVAVAYEEKDAPLLAASPDLLAACKAILREHEAGTHDGGTPGMAALRAAIRKAGGAA